MVREIIKIEKEDFPPKLANIKNPPKRLYAIGDISLLYEDSFAIIGTRRISEYGIKNCKNFTREFSLRRIVTVSGMALGTDTIVHKETIASGGKTIAVLGCGFNQIFPTENEELFNEIIESGGLVLSEYDENTKYNKSFFPKRNRIISAISEGVLVIEAAYRSGTTITARNSIEQGKRVFAVPGLIGLGVGVGVNNLIKNGAILSTNIFDIIQFYPQFLNKKRINVSQRTFIKKEYREVYKIIKEKSSYVDEISDKLEMKISDLVQLLTEMEFEKLICQGSDGRYQIPESSDI